MITLDEKLNVVLSKRLRSFFPQPALEQNLVPFEGKPIRLPEKLAEPDSDFLRYHREEMFQGQISPVHLHRESFRASVLPREILESQTSAPADQSENGRRLRQSSPFAVIMPQNERQEMLARYEARRPRTHPAGV
jgi:hypothetical protein